MFDESEYAVINLYNHAIIYRPGSKELADTYCDAHNNSKAADLAILEVKKISNVTNAFDYKVVNE